MNKNKILINCKKLVRFLTRNLSVFSELSVWFDVDHRLDGPFARIQTAGKPVLLPWN